MLAFVRVVGDVIFWHLCYNAKGEYISYEDHRVPRLSQLHAETKHLAMDTLERSRHIVGWSDDVRNFAGAPDADFAIEWTDLPSPNSMCALEKVTISGSAVPFITSGASIALGIKDKALHLGFGSSDDYMGNLFTIEKRHFVFYDTEERRAWLVDGVSTVLHLLRAYLRFYLEDSRVRDYFIYSDGDIEEAGPNVAYTGARAAYEVLKNDKNQRLPLYPKMSEESEERIAKLGTKHEDDVTNLKATSRNFTLKERVEQLCYVLLQITAYHDDIHTQSGFGWRIKKSPRHRIEGFEFMDVATKHDTLWPKVATLDAVSVGWVDFARALHAVPLFGVGFGDLFRPVRTDAPCCSSTASVPTGKDFLAVYGADLEIILRRGSKRKNPWRLVGNIHWHSPDGVAFESCKCKSLTLGGDSRPISAAQRSYKKQDRMGQHRASCEPEKKGLKGMFGERGFGRQKSQKGSSPADRVQVLLPATFPQFYGRGLRSPAKVVPKGAVIFGHSWKFPLRWSLSKDVPPEEGEPDPPSLDEVSNLMDDSGIGTSIDSSSGGDTSASPFFYGLGNNPQVPCGSRDNSSIESGIGSDKPGSEIVPAEQVVQYREDSKKRAICLSEADDHDDLARKLRRVEKRISLG
ncbi:hypothetical protein JDV02_005727 [Purpureocillium takamizusanense]|uniref:Uncharacterized protein n=1 Tax=Purpureocillium takamizusanense TaxID=2060973 RepID=A0A9Q8VC74_9HYPO|nr:uncharacterized protein JDV02_005727 [Purpureocillium takamizusanense]UNI19547.1 hypothetical protein JDV02_005727 [Purpureocillium takamizusanense]